MAARLRVPGTTPSLHPSNISVLPEDTAAARAEQRKLLHKAEQERLATFMQSKALSRPMSSRSTDTTAAVARTGAVSSARLRPSSASAQAIPSAARSSNSVRPSTGARKTSAAAASKQPINSKSNWTAAKWIMNSTQLAQLVSTALIGGDDGRDDLARMKALGRFAIGDDEALRALVRDSLHAGVEDMVDLLVPRIRQLANEVPDVS